jgi:hypothetical protein
MRPQPLIDDNVVHQVAESELALKRPLAEALVGPPQLRSLDCRAGWSDSPSERSASRPSAARASCLTRAERNDLCRSSVSSHVRGDVGDCRVHRASSMLRG